jgi:hypothetical protein
MLTVLAATAELLNGMTAYSLDAAAATQNALFSADVSKRTSPTPRLSNADEHACGGATTVTVAEPSIPSERASMRADPTLTPVTFPVALTEADGSLDDQAITASVTACPVESVIVNVA